MRISCGLLGGASKPLEEALISLIVSLRWPLVLGWSSRLLVVSLAWVERGVGKASKDIDVDSVLIPSRCRKEIYNVGR